MKGPLTGNSITERVVFTGLYVPDANRPAGAEDHGVEPASQDTPDAQGRQGAQQDRPW